ncbi:MAG: hypothetical protein HOW73_27455 [Polyangiaceae bacterium]|nr:hypothetical protein [Polyangiaceae bacterium]
MRKFNFCILMCALTCGLSAAGCVGEETIDEELDEEAALAAKSGAHFVGDPTCVQSGDVLTCSGSVAGLGNQPVTVDLDVTRICRNRGGNDPPGQVSDSSGPYPPNNGRIDFTVSVDADCPGKMTPIFTSPATITILQNGTEVFTGQIFF